MVFILKKKDIYILFKVKLTKSIDFVIGFHPCRGRPRCAKESQIGIQLDSFPRVRYLILDIFRSKREMLQRRIIIVIVQCIGSRGEVSSSYWYTA